MYKFLAASLLAIVFLSCQPVDPEAPQNDYKVHAYYVIPTDKSFSENNANQYKMHNYKFTMCTEYNTI